MSAGKRMPLWLTVLLAMLLLALLAVAALMVRQQLPQTAMKATGQNDKGAMNQASAPAIVYEDFHAAPPRPAPALPSVSSPQATGVALVMDDVGYDLDALRRILSLGVPVAISVLPDAPHPGRAAEMAHEAGQMVMLHLPMEPATEKYRQRMGAAFLRADMDAAELRAVFLEDMSRVPYVEGVNNHMGSHLTSLERPMRQLMRLLKQQGLFFIDSRTSGASVAALAAAREGLPWAMRQIFLDHRQDEAYMQSAWDQALRCQAENRACVVIAHPHPQTIAFLERKFGGLAEGGDAAKRLNLVPVRRLLHAPMSEATRRLLANGALR